jgi:phospholipid/cholesterol/gamma-HCH transport system ATP-binding protein
LWRVADRVAVLGEGRVQGTGSMEELSHLAHPAVRQFFEGPRGAAASLRSGDQRKERAWKQK